MSKTQAAAAPQITQAGRYRTGDIVQFDGYGRVRTASGSTGTGPKVRTGAITAFETSTTRQPTAADNWDDYKAGRMVPRKTPVTSARVTTLFNPDGSPSVSTWLPLRKLRPAPAGSTADGEA